MLIETIQYYDQNGRLYHSMYCCWMQVKNSVAEEKFKESGRSLQGLTAI